MEFIETLKGNLQTYAYATNITLTLLDKEGTRMAQFGQAFQYCALFEEANGKYCPCSKSHLDSSLMSVNLGDAYIYMCPGGLIHFTVPIIKEKAYQGSVLAGPIVLDYPDITQVDSIIQKYNISLNYRSKLYTALTAVPLIEPFQARHLSKLLFLLVTNLLSGEAQRLQELSDKAFQQAKIGEYMQMTKEERPSSPTQYTMEKALISDVLSGNANGAKAILNEMLGQIYFTSGNNIEIIKVRTIELVALLSRATYEVGSSEDSIYHMTESFMHQLTNVKNITDLSYVLMETLEHFTNLAFHNTTNSNLSIIKKSIAYINDHYNQSLTLDMVANHAGLNPAYFSTLFKKEMGVNFSTYLNNLRIDHAKLLLKNSNLSLINIAVELGFDNQSYFTNVFKKVTGITPKQYRQSL
jgi:Response regulator containing CheY-like receiver domain and AraC-type DNA-binding domain